MLQKLIQVGDQKAIILDQALLDHLDLGDDDEIEIQRVEEGLLITSTRIGIGPLKVPEHVKKIRDDYGDTLNQLAE